MKHLFALVFIISFFSTLKGQSQEDFDEFGKLVMHYVTDSTPERAVQYIRIHHYQWLIYTQPISEQQKEILWKKTEHDYSKIYAADQNSIEGLMDTYAIEREDGATFEYFETLYEPLEGSNYTYDMKTSFIYRNGKVQTVVSFVYQAAWIQDRFVLMSDIKEDF